MSRISLASLFLVVSFLGATNVRAELLTELYGVNISDTSDGMSLYTYFNDMFGTGYQNSNDLFNNVGVAPTDTWTVAGDWQMATLVKGTAAFDHRLIISGDSLGSDIVLDGRGMGYQNDGMIAWNAGQLPGGVSGEFTFGLEAYGSPEIDGNKDLLYTWSSNPEDNLYGGNTLDVRMLAFDITDLYNAKYDGDFGSVYMYAWEDMHSDGFQFGGYNDSRYGWITPETWRMDGDYQDAVFIIANVKPVEQSSTPEPASLAIFGCGLVGLGLLHRRVRKRGGERQTCSQGN